MIGRHALRALALASLFVSCAAGAQESGFCPSLKAAFAAGKAGPAALKARRIAGAGSCEFTDSGTLRCTWAFDDKETAASRREELTAAARACLAPLGLTPRRRRIEGIDATLFEAGDDVPTVGIFYDRTIILISIITPD